MTGAPGSVTPLSQIVPPARAIRALTVTSPVAPATRIPARGRPVVPSAPTTSISRSASEPTAQPVLARIRLPSWRTTAPSLRRMSMSGTWRPWNRPAPHRNTWPGVTPVPWKSGTCATSLTKVRVTRAGTSVPVLSGDSTISPGRIAAMGLVVLLHGEDPRESRIRHRGNPA
ncbi:MAG: hypothetical protein IOC92_10285 [Rhodobacter sp.]|nr:hypothetical protein [Rhodobacter sp.]MCA3461040.1 hypothetical protein [Rhodobacter sp.]MCA3464929.1 hypothetical protein [Rhodobacter sp.]MCA3469068.1 hypothetical protein [Rhodobacter sp.]MCA3471600.1 hypothetical protein [Rhodobacter sp.]